MTDTYWLESDSTQRLLPVRDAEELWSLGPVEIDREAVLAVVDGPGWRAKWRAKQLQPCAAPGEKPWRVTRITVDEDAAPMDRASLGLTGDVCKLIRQGRHLRLEDRPQSGVNLEDAGGFDSFEDARAAAYHWVQQMVPRSLRRTYATLYEPPEAVLSA